VGVVTLAVGDEGVGDVVLAPADLVVEGVAVEQAVAEVGAAVGLVEAHCAVNHIQLIGYAIYISIISILP
jgi:hypothetical protein